MLKDTLKESARILQNILTKAHSVPGVAKDVSLLEASEHFSPKNPAGSDLKQIFTFFSQHPAATQAMLKELEILREDLQDFLR